MVQRIEGKTALDWFEEGRECLERGNIDEAIECFDRVLDVDPKKDYVWVSKGIALNHLKRYQEAIECFDKALEIFPNFSDTWLNKGMSLHYLEQYGEAIKCFDKALEIDPDADKAKELRLLSELCVIVTKDRRGSVRIEESK